MFGEILAFIQLASVLIIPALTLLRALSAASAHLCTRAITALTHLPTLPQTSAPTARSTRDIGTQTPPPSLRDLWTQYHAALP